MINGRKKELALFSSMLQDDASHFVAVFGRRRVGKTFLIRETFGYRFTFQHAGLAEGGMEEQLFAFSSSLRDSGHSPKSKLRSWLEAFDALKDVIRNSTERRKVVFLDELSWMDTPKSDLITALENFWNGFASARRDVILIVCASATSWMLSKIVHGKGGLYNRLTEQINLRQFTLKECEEYVQAAGLSLTRNQILQYYMVFGGVPYYWGFLQKGLSLPQNIDAALFARDAPLKDEFKYLYSSIFKNPEPYVRIIGALGRKKAGMTREELIAASGLQNSGDLTGRLEELESCAFIRKYYAFGMKKKNAVYQLVDFFTLFYYKFLEGAPSAGDENFWTNQINTPAINTWMGLAFERVCLEHISQIKARLGIAGVLTEVNSWYCAGNPDKGVFGSQIDLLIVRKDQVINLCEIKYSASEFTVTEKVDREIRNKVHDLSLATGAKYAIYPTLLTTYGLVQNSYSGNIQAVIALDDLF